MCSEFGEGGVYFDVQPHNGLADAPKSSANRFNHVRTAIAALELDLYFGNFITGVDAVANSVEIVNVSSVAINTQAKAKPSGAQHIKRVKELLQ